MTATLSPLADIAPLPTDVTEPIYGFTRAEIDRIKNDWFDRGVRYGRLMEAEDGALAAHLASTPTVRTA